MRPAPTAPEQQPASRQPLLEEYAMSTLDQFVGRELGVSDWLLIDQPLIDQFATCTGDQQWIHVDVERARQESPLGVTIAHGYLILSLLARFSFELGIVPADAGQAINYGAERVRFPAPVKAGSRIRDHVVLLQAETKGLGRALITTRHTIEIDGGERPALVADTLTMLAAE